jgi:hypothetical protein
MRLAFQRLIFPLLFPAIACSCATSPYQSRTLTLTPANEIAVRTGVIRATSMPLGPRRGTVTMSAADGENFFGTYAPLVTPSQKSWEIILTGDKGTEMRCGYQVDSENGHGTGQCELSTGAMYDLSF